MRLGQFPSGWSCPESLAKVLGNAHLYRVHTLFESKWDWVSDSNRRFVVRSVSEDLLVVLRHSEVKRHQSLDSQIAIRMLFDRKANDGMKMKHMY